MKMTVELALGREIKKAREVLQKSQEALAFEAGLHRTYISLIERGKKSPTLAVIVRLAKALGIKPSELLRRVEVEFERVSS
jgi:transcriptional regulator with XRE-family HTH domain